MHNHTGRYFLLLILYSMVSLLVSSCQVVGTPRIVLWHSWEGEQAQVINDAVERYTEIFDDVIVVASYVPADEMLERYTEVAPQGLGPDVFLASSITLRELAQTGLIQSVAASNINTSVYYTSSLASLTVDEQLYGVPFAMRPLALYYNRSLIETPAATLNDLLTQAEAGTGVAINTQFNQVLWGVQAFGGQILDQNQRIVLNQGALTNWLNWLLTANSNPQVFLSRDATTLRQLFIEGRVAYYTGTPSELPLLRSEMGTDMIGVAPLPSGPNGASGPLMQVDALMFNSASSQAGHDRAIDLAVFLTNLEQATTFMRDLQLVPANRRVRVDLRTYPAVAGFIAQTRTAVAIPYLPQVMTLLEQGDDMLLRVLEGVVEPNVAVQDLTSRVNAQFGLTTPESVTPCELDGELTLWHSLTNASADFLTDYVTTLNARCLSFDLSLEFVPRADMITAYLEAFDEGDAPDLILTSTTDIAGLVDADAVLPVGRDRMQSFSPISQATVTIDGIAYGIPVTLVSNVFYTNRTRVADAPVTTDELLVESTSPFVLSRSTDDMFWTVTAYNGITLEAGRVIANMDGINQWLAWLSQVNDAEHIEMVTNDFLRRRQFVAGETAYYIDTNLELVSLTEQLDGALSVALFPTGTGSFASPLVTSLAIFVNPDSPQTDTALLFSAQLTDVDIQETMVEALRWIPANITADVSVAADPELATISQVMRTGIVLNKNPQPVLAAVSQAIDQVFRGEQATDVIAQSMVDALGAIGE